jgi:adenylosuccinate lyase
MATEVILMQCVKAGGDRQILHEAIREHSMAAGKRVKEEGAPNDLLARIGCDPLFSAVHDSIDSLLDPMKFIGRCPEQVDEFISEEIDPIFVTRAHDLEANKVDSVNV